MIKYKNISSYPFTFYGIKFNPGDEKEVPGFINHPKMVRITERAEYKPKAIIAIAKAEKKEEVKQVVQPVPAKRTYTKRNKNIDTKTGGVIDG